MKKVVFILIISMMLVGCLRKEETVEVSSEEELTSFNNEYIDDLTVKENEKIVYHTYMQKLGIYNLDTFEWKNIHSNFSDFAYKPMGESDFFSVGNSLYNYFSVVYCDGNKLNNIVNVDASDSIMPIGIYNNEKYFFYNIDDLQGKVDRKIVKYNEGKKAFEDILYLGERLVAKGVIIEDKIYYGEYLSEEDRYVLYEYNITDKSERMVRDNLKTDYMYNLDGKLIWNDGDGNIVSDNEILVTIDTKEAEFDYNEDLDILFVIFPNDENDLACEIWNCKTGSKIHSVDKYIGYSVENNILKLYCNDKIDELSIDTLKR